MSCGSILWFQRHRTVQSRRAAFDQAGDFTGDGVTDILVIDNFESCIRLDGSRSEADQKKARTGKINDLQSDWRLTSERSGFNKAIAGMCTSIQLNGDGGL